MANIYYCLICKTEQSRYFSYKGYEYYRCTTCGLVSTYPYPSSKTIRSHYQKKFTKGNYELLNTFSEEYKAVYQDFVTVLENYYSKRNDTVKKKKVLDVGCFTGEFLELLQEKGSEVYGVELQEEAVTIANKKLHGHVSSSDVMKDDLPHKKFDVISLLGVVEHVTDPIKLIKRSYELLPRGGLVLIQTPNSGSFLSLTMKKYWPPFQPVEHIHLFSKQALIKALTLAGFSITLAKPHWKKLAVGYVFSMFQNFGSEFYPVFNTLYKLTPPALRKMLLRVYIGEMIVLAKKP